MQLCGNKNIFVFILIVRQNFNLFCAITRLKFVGTLRNIVVTNKKESGNNCYKKRRN